LPTHNSLQNIAAAEQFLHNSEIQQDLLTESISPTPSPIPEPIFLPLSLIGSFLTLLNNLMTQKF